MIKKIIGILVAIASLAVMVVVILNRGNYRSLITVEPKTEVAQPATVISNEKVAKEDLTAEKTQPAELAIEETDSTAVKNEESNR